jgi:predicted phage tail protein
MFKSMLVFVFSIMLLFNIYGCVALLAGAAAGAGTTVWLSGKLTQEFNVPYERAINAAEKALRSLKLEVAKVVKQEDVTQIRSQYNDGKEVWIDVRKITDNSTKVEVRVGAVSSDKVASDKILKQIQRYL